MEEYMERPWRNIWSGPGGWKWLTPLTGIGCVHHIEEKDCTARFATGAIREIPDWKINQGAPAAQAGLYREGPFYSTYTYSMWCTDSRDIYTVEGWGIGVQRVQMLPHAFPLPCTLPYSPSMEASMRYSTGGLGEGGYEGRGGRGGIYTLH